MLMNEPLIQRAALAAFFSSIACGVTGSFVVVKKMSYLAGGLAHAVLGGIGIAYFFKINPILGASVFAVIAAMIIGLVHIHFKQKVDTLISAIWTIGMSTGIILMYLTPGYQPDLLSYLFGNILMVSKENIIILAVFDLILLIRLLFSFRQFVYISFDEEYSKLRELRFERLTLMMLILTAIAIVLLSQTIGILLVIAMMSLPAAIAENHTRSLGMMIFTAIILNLIFYFSGLAVSFSYNLPSGATIILIAGFSFILSILVKKLLYRFRHLRKS